MNERIVVHQAHGPCRVNPDPVTETFFGDEVLMVVLDPVLDPGTLIKVAEDRLSGVSRPVIDRDTLAEVAAMLAAPEVEFPQNWAARTKAMGARIVSGDPVELAHVIRVVAEHSQGRVLQPREAGQMRTAYRLLVAEIGMLVDDPHGWVAERVPFPMHVVGVAA